MKLTIGIPLHNTTSTICLTLSKIVESCEYYNYDYQIIVIDDYSNDETVETVTKYIQNNPKILLFHTKDFIKTKNPNLAWNMNFIFDKIRKDDDFYLHIECDIIILKDTIPNLIEGYEKYKNQVSTVVPLYLNKDTKSINWAVFEFFPKDKSEEDFPNEKILNVDKQDFGHHTLAIPIGCALIDAKYLRDPNIRIDTLLKFWTVDDELHRLIYTEYNKSVLFYKKAKAIHLGSQSHKGDMHPYFAAAVHKFNIKWDALKKNKKTNLTIGMPVHNALPSIQRSIPSVIKWCEFYEYDYQFIIIDDNSDSDTKKYLNSIENQRIKVLHTEDFIPTPNPNLSWNINKLIEQVRENDEFYLNLESDVIINRYTIPIMIYELTNNTNISGVIPLLTRDDMTIAWPPTATHEVIMQSNMAYFGLKNPPQLGCLMLPKWVIDNKLCRADPNIRLWYADFWFNRNLVFQTRKPIKLSAGIFATHIGGQSSQGIEHKWEGLETLEEVKQYMKDKWVKRLQYIQDQKLRSDLEEQLLF